MRRHDFNSWCDMGDGNTNIYCTLHNPYIHIYMPKNINMRGVLDGSLVYVWMCSFIPISTLQTKHFMTLFHWRFCDFSFAGLSSLSQFYFYQFLSLYKNALQCKLYNISIENKNWKLVHQWSAGSGYNRSDWIERLWILSNWLLIK